MNNDKNIFDTVCRILENCVDYLDYVKTYNECAYTDRKIESILDYSNKLSKEYSNNFNNNKYSYEILNYWNDADDLYVQYIVENTETEEKANVIELYNTDDLNYNYTDATSDEIADSLLSLIKRKGGSEFELPKASNLRPLLLYIYDRVCESESNMCHIDYNEWEELKEDYDFLEEDIITLKAEIKKYNLDDYITVDDNEYKICGYGGLQCRFNDDRDKGSDELER